MSTPFLSIIIPAHNEEHRLPSTMEQVWEFIRSQPFMSEVWVIENGSQDRTLALAEAFAEQHPEFHVIHETRRGKGLAVRRGMLEAQGEYRFMCDADLSMPIAEVVRFLPPALENFEIAIGSREAPGAVRFNEPSYRHIGGRLINWMIRVLALPGLHDTQCGFKCFRGDITTDLFGCQTLTGWSFDIELLFIARKRGYRVRELPIPWYFNPETKLNAVRDAIQMGLDIFTIHLNNLKGRYKPKGALAKVKKYGEKIRR